MIEYLRPGYTRHLLLFALFLGPASLAPAASVAVQLPVAQRQILQREARLVVDLLQNHHFSGRAFREMDSKTMVSRFIEELDPQAEFLDAADHEFLHRRFDRTLKSVYLFRGDLQPAFEIFDRFVARAEERLAWVRRRLDRGFDFSEPETRRDREGKPVPFATRAEADHYWDLLLKERMLVEILRGRTTDEASQEVRRQYARIERAIAAYDALAVRERFFDAIIRSFDPHSGYFSADSTREFAVEMEKAVVGVGLSVRKEDGQCVVAALQRGGPADLAGDIQPGDILEAVADYDGAWRDLEGLRLREIVGLLRGAAGTRLQIAYRPEGETDRRLTTLERRRVDLGSERAYGAVSEVPGADSTRRIGWIMLPNFYASGQDSSVSSAARDVRELLASMNAAELEGLVIDLRTNPGGALTEAAALSELFLPEGVMMLSRGLDGKVTEHRLKNGPPVYTGPLVVLVSSASASASEVFAGAMKYHQRALIVGAAETFGKGTVQNYIDLAKLPGGLPEWGTLRLTRERFFLPDGGSVQFSGVASDLVFPDDRPRDEQRREADVPGALPAETVPPPAGLAPATPDGLQLTAALQEQLAAHAAENIRRLPEWQLIREAVEMNTQRQQEKERPLQLDARRLLWEEQSAATHAWWLRRRERTAQAAYPTRAYDTRERRDILAAEDARLRDETGGEPVPLHRLHQGAFVIETAGGLRRKIRLESFDFLRRVAEADALTPRLNAASGRTFDAGAVRRFLQRASLLENVTVPALTQVAGELTGHDMDTRLRREALESVLLAITRMDESFEHERNPLDVPLREALRLAARWAELTSTHPVSP